MYQAFLNFKFRQQLLEDWNPPPTNFFFSARQISEPTLPPGDSLLKDSTTRSPPKMIS